MVIIQDNIEWAAEHLDAADGQDRVPILQSDLYWSCEFMQGKGLTI